MYVYLMILELLPQTIENFVAQFGTNAQLRQKIVNHVAKQYGITQIEASHYMQMLYF